MVSMKLSLLAIAGLFVALHVEASYFPETPPETGYRHNFEEQTKVIPHHIQVEIDKLNAESFARIKAEEEAEAKKMAEAKERPKRRNLLVGRYGFRIGKRGILNQDYKEESELTPLSSRPLKRDVNEYDR